MMSDVRAWLASLTPEKRDYALLHLPSHLSKSDEPKSHNKLYKCLTNFIFVDAKISHPEIPVLMLIEDYTNALNSSLLSEEQIKTLKLLQEVLQLSTHILERNNTQLAGHLLGRLLLSQIPDIKKMLEQATASQIKTWLRPLNQNLQPPNSSNVRTIYSYSTPYDIDGTPLDSAIQGREFLLSQDGKYIIFINDVVTACGELRFLNWQTGNIDYKLGYSNRIRAYSLTLDGRFLVSISEDKTLKVWNIQTGNQTHDLVGIHRINIEYDVRRCRIVITPNNKYIICALSEDYNSANKCIRVWHLRTGESFNILENCADWEAEPFALTPDGKYLVIGNNNDTTIEIWDWQKSNRIHALEGHELRVIHRVAFSSDSKHLISCSNYSTLKIWNWKDGAFLGEFNINVDCFENFLFTQDGRYLISCCEHEQSIRIWNWQTRELTCTLNGHSDGIVSLATTTDGNYLVSSSQDETFKIWDLQRATSTENVQNHINPIIALSIMPDNKHVISVSSDLIFTIWNWQTREAVDTFKIKNKYSVISIPTKYKNLIYKIEELTESIWRNLKYQFYSLCENVNVILNEFYSLCESLNVYLVRDTEKCERILDELELKVSGIWEDWLLRKIGLYPRVPPRLDEAIFAFTPDCNHIIYSSGSTAVQVWNLKTRKRVHHILKKSLGYENAITPDGKHIVSIRDESIIVIRNWQRKKVIHILKEYKQYDFKFPKIKISPNGKYLLLNYKKINDEHIVELFNLQTGKEVYSSKTDNFFDKNCLFYLSIDSKYAILKSNLYDQRMKILNWQETNDEISWLECDTISKFSDHSCSQLLVFNGERRFADDIFQVYNWQTNEVIAEFIGDGAILCHVFAPDMKTLIAGDSTGQVQFFCLEGI